MRSAIALATLMATLLVVTPLSAQRAPHAVRTTTLDVIGPRSSQAVRSWLTRSAATLADCRELDDVPVRIAFAIAPDGSLLEPSVGDDDTDEALAACVSSHLASWHAPGRSTSVTTVTWSFVLTGSGVSCHCFGWVHGPDFGTSCERTPSACEREARALGRDHTECRAQRRAQCDDEATIGGQRMTHP